MPRCFSCVAIVDYFIPDCLLLFIVFLYALCFVLTCNSPLFIYIQHQWSIGHTPLIHWSPRSNLIQTRLYSHSEVVRLKVTLRGNDQLLLECIYRSSSSSPPNNSKLCDLLQMTQNDSGYSHILIWGDFNYPWDWLDHMDHFQASRPSKSEISQHIQKCIPISTGIWTNTSQTWSERKLAGPYPAKWWSDGTRHRTLTWTGY